ncbi:MAG: DUF1365 domain-containing protein [Opitutales bacterium]|nr:DUF1365 domain-containing protein [Opitutales bacterium]
MKPAVTASALYECTVRHERFAPQRHLFAYRLFYFALDLDELDMLPDRLVLFSLRRANCFQFRECDFLPTGEPLHHPTGAAPALPAASEPASLKSRVRAFCSAHGADFGPDGRVLLITIPRVFGFQFNPVSFYYCFDAAGRPVGAIAEVTNTYREVKLYFVPPSAGWNGVFHLHTPKQFYVSPFFGLELMFDLTLRVPGEKLSVRIDDHDGGRCVLHTTLTGARRPLTDARLAWFLLKYPLVTLRIVARIHWQAFRLWLKRVPYFPKSDGAAAQRDLYRPHASIADHSSP